MKYMHYMNNFFIFNFDISCWSIYIYKNIFSNCKRECNVVIQNLNLIFHHDDNNALKKVT